jgi:hypothetical protein
VITDGDLRRNIERGLDHSGAEFMTRDPKTIAPTPGRRGADPVRRASDHGLVRGRGRGKKPVGVLHIHDCPRAMNVVILIPARFAIVALSGKAAGRAEGRGGTPSR